MGTFMVHCQPSSLCLQFFLVNCLRCKAIFSHILEVSDQAPSAIIWYVLCSYVHIHAICIIYMHYLPQLTYNAHAIYYIICIMHIMHISSAIYADIYYIICMHILQITCVICLRLHTIRITRRYAATSSAHFNYTAQDASEKVTHRNNMR